MDRALGELLLLSLVELAVDNCHTVPLPGRIPNALSLRFPPRTRSYSYLPHGYLWKKLNRLRVMKKNHHTTISLIEGGICCPCSYTDMFFCVQHGRLLTHSP